jgi:hypothetical protein
MVRDVRINGFLGEDARRRQAEAGHFLALGNATHRLLAATLPVERAVRRLGIGRWLRPDDDWIAARSILSSPTPISSARRSADAPHRRTAAIARSAKSSTISRIVTSSLSELFGTRLAAALGAERRLLLAGRRLSHDSRR